MEKEQVMRTALQKVSFGMVRRTMLYGFALTGMLIAGGSDWTTAAEVRQTVMTPEEVGIALKNDFADAKFTRIQESGIAGLYEVTVGQNIIYYAPAAGKIITGEIHDKSGLNITAEKRKMLLALKEAETAKLVDTLPLAKAVKIGSGKNIVIEFTDIDCVFCRKVEEFFRTRDDVTRYVFFMPLDSIHPQAKAKAKEVLCAIDPAAEYLAAMSGSLDKAELKGCGGRDQELDEVLAEHKAAADKMGVTGTPAMWVNKKQVNGADVRKLQRYLSEEPANSAAVPASKIP